MSLKVSIPKPCHENWAAMSPDDKGRFCSLCAKTVVDFTAMQQPEVEGYLLANADKKVCGRFTNNQLDDAPVVLRIPRKALFSQTSFRNVFLLALVISMGTTLFSCRNRTVGEVAITQGDTITIDSVTEKTQAYKGIVLNCSKPGDTLADEKPKLVQPALPDGIMLGEVAINPQDTVATPEPAPVSKTPGKKY